MEKLDQELLDIALEGLSKNKPKVEALEKSTKESAIRMHKHQAQYVKDKRLLSKQIEATKLENATSLQEAIDNLRVPEDGKDGRDGSDGKNGKDGKDGKDGENGRDGVQGPSGESGVPGMPGRDGLQGKEGKPGVNGKDGTGILDITSTTSKLLVELDDGRVVDIVLPKAKEVPAGVTTMPTEIVVLRNLADTANIDTAEEGQVLTYSNGKWIPGTPVIGGGSVDTARMEIESLFKVAEATAYKELIYDQGSITNVDIYTSASKTTKLFSKVIGYNNGNITSVSITDESNGGTLNKILNYSNSNLLSVESTYEII